MQHGFTIWVDGRGCKEGLGGEGEGIAMGDLLAQFVNRYYEEVSGIWHMGQGGFGLAPRWEGCAAHLWPWAVTDAPC